MKIESEFCFNAPRQEVWDILQDPDVLATAVPGTQKLDKIGDDEYRGDMHIEIGPLSGVFTGIVVLSDKVEPESYRLTIDARGPLGFSKGEGWVKLVAQDDENTLMKYDIDLQVGGKIASVGQRLMETVGKSVSRQSLEALNKNLEARKTGAQVSAPTQGKFMRAVAKDVFAQIFTPRRLVIGAIVLAAIGAALAFWFGYWNR